jgi:predicted TIM-barrel fold metal-dependent hydrolase
MHDAAAIRRQLGHPVLDCDGHWIESAPVFTEYLRTVAGPAQTDAYRALMKQRGQLRWVKNSPADRLQKRIPHELGAGNSGTVDLATAMLPALMYERMGELGIDFSIIYPSMGLGLLGVSDDELRANLVRAYNTMASDIYRPHGDRLAPVAIIPTHNPTEAIAEVEYAVRELGFKAIMLFGAFPRPMPVSSDGSFVSSFALASFKVPYYVDVIGLDDDAYDPFWQKCIDLGVAVTSHAGATDWADRRSISNNMFNHIGHFAQANHAFAKGIFFGGVTRRFPRLNFAFLEGGVGYGMTLLWDILGHFEKFNLPSLMEHFNPERTDHTKLRELFSTYGTSAMQRKLDDIMAGFPKDRLEPLRFFERAGVESEDEIVELYTKNYYFGCEADDPATAWAFDAKRGVPLKTVFSSDLSHPDVPVMTHVLPEAFELVDKGLLDEADFKRFVFSNGVGLHGGMNAEFFQGTAIENEAAALLANR